MRRNVLAVAISAHGHHGSGGPAAVHRVRAVRGGWYRRHARHPGVRGLMVRAIAVVVVCASSLAAQPLAVRTRLGASDTPWMRAALTPAPADSFDIALGRDGLVLRTAPGALDVQRDRGFNRKKGALVGALIVGGAFAAAAISEGGLETLGNGEFYVWESGFALGGALYGALLTPRSWETYSVRSAPCGGYRFAPGSTVALRMADGRRLSGAVGAHAVDSLLLTLSAETAPQWIPTRGATLDFPTTRNRRRGALLWGAGGALLGGLAYAFGPKNQREESLNAAIALGGWGAVAGALIGTKREQAVQLPRC